MKEQVGEGACAEGCIRYQGWSQNERRRYKHT